MKFWEILCFGLDKTGYSIEGDPAHSFVHEGGVKNEDSFEVLEILDGEQIKGGEEVFVGIFGGTSVDVDDGVVLVGAGDEID